MFNNSPIDKGFTNGVGLALFIRDEIEWLLPLFFYLSKFNITICKYIFTVLLIFDLILLFIDCQEDLTCKDAHYEKY
ncbi:Uncharacterised protein [Serratia marcescens]|nr:hypothetical protein NUKP40_38920 [Klebsiella variicola]CAI1687515.1 Uncharacterised protein [Serratia marcescens]